MEKKKEKAEQISKWRISYTIPWIMWLHWTEEIEWTVEDVYKFIYENELEMLVSVITRVNNSYNSLK